MTNIFCNQDFTVPGRDPQTILMRLYIQIRYSVAQQSLINLSHPLRKINLPCRIPANLPQMSVRIEKMTGIASQKVFCAGTVTVAPALLACSITSSTSSLLPTLWPIVNSEELGNDKGTFASTDRSLRFHIASFTPACKSKTLQPHARIQCQ